MAGKRHWRGMGTACCVRISLKTTRFLDLSAFPYSRKNTVFQIMDLFPSSGQWGGGGDLLSCVRKKSYPQLLRFETQPSRYLSHLSRGGQKRISFQSAVSFVLYDTMYRVQISSIYKCNMQSSDYIELTCMLVGRCNGLYGHFFPLTEQARFTSVHVGFVVNKMSLTQNFLQVLYFLLSTTFRQCPVPYTDAEPSHQLTAPSTTAVRSCTAHPCMNLPLL